MVVSVRAAALIALISALIGAGATRTWAAFARSTAETTVLSTASLAAPTNLQVSTTSTQAILSWTASTSTFASGTRVLRSSAAAGPFAQIAQIAGLATTSYTDTPAAGTWYYTAITYLASGWTSSPSSAAVASVGPITFVQAGKGGGTAGTFSASFTAVPAAGNLLVAVASTRANGVMTTPTGWSVAVSQTGTAAPDQTIFYRRAGPGEPMTLAVTTTAIGTGNGLQLFEFNGVTTLIGSGSAAGSGTAVSAGSVTTTNARSLLVGVLATSINKSSSSYGSWTNTFTERNDFFAGTGSLVTLFGGASRTVTAAGAYGTAATAGNSGAWRGQIVAFR